MTNPRPDPITEFLEFYKETKKILKREKKNKSTDAAVSDAPV